MKGSKSNEVETLWTAEDVAAFLNISIQYVYRLSREGSIPSLKIGAALRFRPSDIEAWIEARTRPVAEGIA